MNSKFNMKSKPNSSNNVMWSTKPYTQDYLDKEKAESDKIRQKYLAKKLRIEHKHLEEVSFRDLYEFPFKDESYSWVYDKNGNFIFQFEIDNKETREKCLSIINGDLEPTKENSFVHDGGVIYLEKDGDRLPIILIRGWGNLTGIGAYNLDGEYASKIQDTLAVFIVNQLTFSPN